MEHIIAAAIRFEGMVYSVPRPGRHHDVIRHIAETVPGVTMVGVDGREGFIASDGASQGRFVGRVEARAIAETAGQLIPGRRDIDGVPYIANDDRLFSEDVW